MMFDIRRGDCLALLRQMPESSIDSIVTDPPYGLSFMGQQWDHDVPGVKVWAECFRVLKPGGHLLAFAGTRTQHRMAQRIEDAGFQIRDMIAWAYGSGFPKSCNVTESMEHYLAGEPPAVVTPFVRPDVYRITAFLRAARDKAGWTNRQIDALFGTNGMAGHWTTAGSQPQVPSLPQWKVLQEALGFGNEWDALVAEIGAKERPEGSAQDAKPRFLQSLDKTRVSAPADGWGTGLKPALEPITVARKPPKGSTAHNVRALGTGALNIRDCRVPFTGKESGKSEAGRWPANLLHDGSEEVTGVLGEAARFFYCPKASKQDREAGNSHPTVKPTDLMRYLCRLVTPPGGTVLDPFMGSGSTGKAAVLEGFRFVGCELSDEYADIAMARIQRAAA